MTADPTNLPSDGIESVPEFRRENDRHYFDVKTGPFQSRTDAEQFAENFMIFVRVFDRWMGAHEEGMWDRLGS